MLASTRRRLAGLVLAGVLSATLAGCSGAQGGTTGSKPTVVAAFYPLQYVAERVAGTTMEVETLAAAGVEPHDLQLTVEQTAAIVDAELVFYEQGLQPAVDETVAQNAPDHVVDTTDVVPTKGDLHFWLDPLLLADAAEALADEMGTMDPVHREEYVAGYRALRKELTGLDRDFATGLADCDVRTVVVSHDAFGYWGRYGLDFVAINGLTPDAEPSLAHIAELQDLIESEGITTVFSEELATPEHADALAGDLGLATAVLDPVEGLSERTSDEDYLSLMRRNLDALRQANACT